MEVVVEEINRGDRITLLNGKEVIVENIMLRDGRISVQWRSGQKLRKPHRNAGEWAHLGTLQPTLIGGTVSLLEHVKRA